MTMKFIIDEPGPDRPFINCNNQVAPRPLSLLPPPFLPSPIPMPRPKGAFFRMICCGYLSVELSKHRNQ